jgi:hypothetical protein
MYKYFSIITIMESIFSIFVIATWRSQDAFNECEHKYLNENLLKKLYMHIQKMGRG